MMINSFNDKLDKMFPDPRCELEYNKDYELLRLENEQARAFYEMFIEWKKNNTTYGELISNLMNYWNSIKLNYLYIGSKWGECKRSNNDHVAN